MPIAHRQSNVAGKVPTAAQLVNGEIAVNVRDGKVFVKRDDGQIVSLDKEVATSVADGEARSAIYDQNGKIIGVKPGYVKLATFSSSTAYSEFAGTYSLNMNDTASEVNIIFSILLRVNGRNQSTNVLSASNAYVSILGGAGGQLIPDNGIIVQFNTPESSSSSAYFELWVKKEATNYGSLSLFEVSKRSPYFANTYFRDATWSNTLNSTLPTTIYSNGLEYKDYKVFHAGNSFNDEVKPLYFDSASYNVNDLAAGQRAICLSSVLNLPDRRAWVVECKKTYTESLMQTAYIYPESSYTVSNYEFSVAYRMNKNGLGWSPWHIFKDPNQYGIAHKTYSKGTSFDLDNAPIGSVISVNGTENYLTANNYNWPEINKNEAVWFNVFTYGDDSSPSSRITQFASQSFYNDSFADKYKQSKTFIRSKHDSTWGKWRELLFTDNSEMKENVYSFFDDTFPATRCYSGPNNTPTIHYLKPTTTTLTPNNSSLGIESITVSATTGNGPYTGSISIKSFPGDLERTAFEEVYATCALGTRINSTALGTANNVWITNRDYPNASADGSRIINIGFQTDTNLPAQTNPTSLIVDNTVIRAAVVDGWDEAGEKTAINPTNGVYGVVQGSTLSIQVLNLYSCEIGAGASIYKEASCTNLVGITEGSYKNSSVKLINTAQQTINKGDFIYIKNPVLNSIDGVPFTELEGKRVLINSFRLVAENNGIFKVRKSSLHLTPVFEVEADFYKNTTGCLVRCTGSGSGKDRIYEVICTQKTNPVKYKSQEFNVVGRGSITSWTASTNKIYFRGTGENVVFSIISRSTSTDFSSYRVDSSINGNYVNFKVINTVNNTAVATVSNMSINYVIYGSF